MKQDKIKAINPKLKRDSGSDNLIRLNLNESSLDLPLALKEKVWDRLKYINWNRYPEEENPQLLSALANYCEQPPENILPGNGSNELIQTLMNASFSSGPIVFFKPSFSIYSHQARVLKKSFLEIPHNLEKGYEPGPWLKKLSSAGLILIDSPSNPLGCVIGQELLREILKKARCLVVVDEAYAEFSSINYLPWVQQYDNLVLLRTFSKAFRLAGARFGYLIAQKFIVEKLRQIRLPFSVGIFQQVAASLVLEKKKLISQQIERIKMERQRIFHHLRQLTLFQPLPSQANFILVKSKTFTAAEVFSRLKAKGILVKTFEWPELKNFFRVTVGRRTENNIFLKEIIRVEQEGK